MDPGRSHVNSLRPRMRLVVDLESLRSVNIGVPLRGRDRGVPEQFLDHPEVGAGDRLKWKEQSVRPHAQPAKGRRSDAKTMRRRFRSHLFAEALVLEEVSRWLRFISTEVGSIDILCVAVQTTDEALLTYLMIDVGMFVRRVSPDAFEFGNANPDLRETLVVFEFDTIIGPPRHL